MNCDEFLESLESSDAQLRAEAGHHANSCSNCAELADIHALLQKELRVVPPLSPRLRAVWEAAANEVPWTTIAKRTSETPVSQFPLALASLAAALLLLVSVFLLTGQRHVDVVVKPSGDKELVPLLPGVVVKTIDASAELDELLAQVNALETELELTAKHAETLDARRQANKLLATYNHW